MGITDLIKKKKKGEPAGNKVKNVSKNVKVAPQTKAVQAKNDQDNPLTPKEENRKPEVIDPIVSIKKDKVDVWDVIAPRKVEVDFDFLKINNVYLRSFFIVWLLFNR